MADYWSRVPVDEYGTPIPVDPRLLDTTPVRPTSVWYPPSSRASRPGYLSPSLYVPTREDLSSSSQRSASDPKPTLVQADTSSPSHASTQRDASQAYPILASSPNSTPAPFDSFLPNYAQTSGESSSPYYSSIRHDASQAMQTVDPSSNSVPVPFDRFSPNYAQSPREHSSPYHSSTTSFQPGPAPTPFDTSLPSSALTSEEYASPEVYISSYPPLTLEGYVSPYLPSRTSFDPMSIQFDTSPPSHALRSEVYASPEKYVASHQPLIAEEYVSPYWPQRRSSSSMPMPVDALPSSSALPPRYDPLDYQSSKSSFRPIPMLDEISSPSNALPPRDVPMEYRLSRSSFNPIPMPIVPSSSNYGPPSSYHPPSSNRRRSGYGLRSRRGSGRSQSRGIRSGYGAPSAYGHVRHDDALTDHQSTPRGAPQDNAPQGGRDYGPADTSMISGQGVPSQALASASAQSGPGYAGSQGRQMPPNVQGQTGIHRWPRDPEFTMYGHKIYTNVCGIVTPSKWAPGQAPTQAGINRPNDPFHCPICDARFDRVRSVTTHFRACVKVNGNPEGKFWLDHPSLGAWKGPRNDKSLYMTNRPAWNAMQQRLLAPAPPRASATDALEMERLAENALRQASKEREEEGGE